MCLTVENGLPLDLPQLKININNIRQKPIECLKDVSATDKATMQQIGTAYALDYVKKTFEMQAQQ